MVIKMKRVLIVVSFLVLFLMACGDEQIYAEQPYQHDKVDYDYPEYIYDDEEKPDFSEEIVPNENMHPFAVTLSELIANPPEYVTLFVEQTGVSRDVVAFLVDVDGNGTQGMVVRTWELHENGMLFGKATLFYLYNDIVRSVELGHQGSSALTTVNASNRMVSTMFDGGRRHYFLSTTENGKRISYIHLFMNASLTDDTVDFYLNNEPITESEFYEIHARYELEQILYFTEEELAIKTDYILSMTK